MNNQMAELTEVLRNNPNHAYDFIANNYWKFSKDELKDIIKELLYSTHSNILAIEHDKILEDVAIELEELYDEEN